MEKRATEKKDIKRRVKGYFRKDGKKIKGYTKTISKYPRKYRTFRKINGSIRFVEITRIGKKETIRVIDSEAFQSVLYIHQPDKLKQSVPYTKFMKKDLHNREIQAFKKLAEDWHEKSYAIDFERYLKYPERIAITKGGLNATMMMGDFELFGHSHPYSDKSQKLPSVSDIRNMTTFKPEFIIAYPKFERIDQGGIEIYFLSIEDLQKYDNWNEQYKDSGKHDHSIGEFEIWSEGAKIISKEKDPKKKEQLKKQLKQIDRSNLLDSELGRQIYFERTGVKIYPYNRSMVNVNLELPEYPRPEYAIIPSPSKESLKEWQSHLKPYLNEEKTKEAILKRRNEIYNTDSPRYKNDWVSLEEKVTQSQEFLAYLADQQKEGIMNKYILNKEIEKEVAYCRELAQKIEEQKLKEQKEHKEYDNWLKNPNVPVE